MKRLVMLGKIIILLGFVGMGKNIIIHLLVEHDK